MAPTSMAAKVVTGIRALRRAWRMRTRFSEMPLARAVRRKSELRTSSMDVRM